MSSYPTCRTPSRPWPAPCSTAARTSPSSGSPARRARPAPRTSWRRCWRGTARRSANTGSLNSEVGVPLTVRASPRPRASSWSRWEPAGSATSTTSPGSPRRRRRGPQRRHRPRRRVRLARRDRRGEVRARPGAPATGLAVLNLDDPVVAAMGQRTPAPASSGWASPRRPTSAPRGSGSTRPGAPRSPWSRPRVRPPSASACTVSTTSATPCRSPPSRSRWACRLRRSPRRWARRAPPAAGGWRSTSGPTA